MSILPEFMRHPAPAAHAPAPAAGPPPPRIDVVWLNPGDSRLADALAIERAAGRPAPEMATRLLLSLPDVVGMVALGYPGGRERVVGWMAFEMDGRRLGVERFVVDPTCRRRGVGRAMVAKLKEKLLCPRRRPRLEVRVNERDGDAIGFWRAMGLKAVGVERGYFGPDDDAIRFRFRVAADGVGPYADAPGDPHPPADRERERS